MVTSYAGRNLEAPALIERSRRTAESACSRRPALSQHLARLALLCRNEPAIAEADVGLLVDVDVPWIPKHTKETRRPGGRTSTWTS